ncbi:unnamed protein product [Rotaria sordida]|uniref:Uncharacterized protein n=1 Tax=Rotaria sordida TaxID=392033 RepID=A0A815ZKF5_9BILA|nr:unnamed protein product [Rotaria sordida]CAF1583959.1 unnamed protein product [Rotaria sordida]
MSSNCTNPQHVPLVGNTLCVARTALTGIFLACVIVSGVCLLLLIGSLIFFYKRRISSSHGKYYHNDESTRSDISNNDKSNLSDISYTDDDGVRSNLSTPSTDRRISRVLKQIIDKNPSKDSIHASLHHNLTIQKSQTSLSSLSSPSSQSYIGLHPLSESSIRIQQQTTNIISTQYNHNKWTTHESHESISTIPDQTDDTNEYKNIISSKF